MTRIYRNLQELREITGIYKNFLINTSYKIVLTIKILFTIARGSGLDVFTMYRNYNNLQEFTWIYRNSHEFTDQTPYEIFLATKIVFTITRDSMFDVFVVIGVVSASQLKIEWLWPRPLSDYRYLSPKIKDLNT